MFEYYVSAVLICVNVLSFLFKTSYFYLFSSVGNFVMWFIQEMAKWLNIIRIGTRKIIMGI